MLLIEHWYPRKYSVTCTFTILIVIVIGVVHPHVQERRGGIEHHRRAPVHVADRALVPEEVFGDLHVYDLARHGAQDDVAAAGMLCTTLSAHLAMVTRFSNFPAARQSYGMEFTLQAALRNPAVCRAPSFSVRHNPSWRAGFQCAARQSNHSRLLHAAKARRYGIQAPGRNICGRSDSAMYGDHRSTSIHSSPCAGDHTPKSSRSI